jgi:hypothetical protein
MPEAFSKLVNRTSNTTPMGSVRKVDVRNLAKYGALGIMTGFHVAVQTVNSVLLNVSRGIAVGPGGKEVLVGADPMASTQVQAQALFLDVSPFDVRANLTAAIYNAIDPAAHSIMLTLNTVTEVIKAHKITVAEAAAITNADLAGFDLSFEAATADHAARGRVSQKNPDTLNAAAQNVATEFILAIAVKNVLGAPGVLSAVTLRREKSAYTDFNALP